MDERIVELETRLAYQEETLRVLNDIVTRQQLQIERLERACRELADRLARGGDGGDKGSPVDEIPPHY